MTKFANVKDEKQPPYTGAQFPPVRPAGVTSDEWRALQASRIDGGGEIGVASYTLLDVDR